MPRRGEVWWVRLDPTLGSEIRKRRPCVIMSSNVVNERRKTLVVIPLSSSPQAAPPLLAAVQCAGEPAMAVVDQIRAVSKERLDGFVETLSAEHLKEIEDGLQQVLELN